MINSKDYLRQVGISEEQFSFLLKRLEQEILRTTQKIKTGYNALCLATQYRTINANIIQSI